MIGNNVSSSRKYQYNEMNYFFKKQMEILELKTVKPESQV
jgi:hypothetical protein